ncbi:hypothetical protein [Anabaena sp. FACHB-1237]
MPLVSAIILLSIVVVLL